jgi:hypothetical protein
VAGIGVAAAALAAPGFKTIRERLLGYEEVLSVSTGGRGDFHARINNAGTMIAYELSYRDLEGDVQQAHIHFGERHQNGGISVFLCTNLGNGPAGTQLCPADPATISGTIEAADVIGPAGQGIAAGEFAELLRAMRAGATYVNVHSSTWPGGEIRAQIDGNSGRGDGGDDDD